MECAVPAYPLKYVSEKIINDLADHLNHGELWKLFAQELDKLCQGSLGFTTTKLLGIGSYTVNHAKFILKDTLGSNKVTTRTWQIALERLELSAANVLPRYLREIHDNFTRDQQHMFPGQPGSSNSCTCDSCLQTTTANNINNFDIDGSSLNFTQTEVTSCNRTSCGSEKEQCQQACINGQAEGQCLNGLGVNGQGLDEQVLNGQGLDGQCLDGQRLGDQGLHGQGLDDQGLNGQGFNRRGFNDQGLNGRGFNDQGLNGRGFNEQGLNRQGLDGRGFIGQGHNGRGFIGQGLNRQGLNGRGFNGQGLNRQGLDGRGFIGQGHNGRGFIGQGLNGRGFIGQGLGDQGRNGQSLNDQPPCYNCFCDDCEKERLLDPDETMVLKINTNKNKGVTEPIKSKSCDKSPCKDRNRQFGSVHNGSESVCTCDISKIYADAIAHAKCSCGDYSDNRNTKTKQNRYSDPNERFYKIAELTQRSSSEGDICEQILQLPQAATRKKRRLRIFVSFADDGRRHVTEVINMISTLQKNPDFLVKFDLENTRILRDLQFNDYSMADRMLNVNDWIDRQYRNADFVIFCISPAYSEYIEPSYEEDVDSRAYPNSTRLHVRYIHDIARSEQVRSSCQNERFRPLLFPASGATRDHTPLFLRSTISYRFPNTFCYLYDYLIGAYQRL